MTHINILIHTEAELPLLMRAAEGKNVKNVKVIGNSRIHYKLHPVNMKLINIKSNSGITHISRFIVENYITMYHTQTKVQFANI